MSPSPKNWSFADLMTLIRDDLDRQVMIADQPFQRYFTLTNLANDPDVSPEILQRHRDALTQLLPALSIADPTGAKPIDAEQMVFRVDTRAWDGRMRRSVKNSTATTLMRCSSRRTPLRTNSETSLMTWSAGWVRLTATTRLMPESIGLSRPSATHNTGRTLLNLTHASPEEIEERSQRIASLRTQWADLLTLYDRPLDLAAVGREVGVADEQRIRQTILLLPEWSDDKLGLKPLTEGKRSVAQLVVLHVPYTTYGQVCQQLKLGRRLLVR